METVKEFINVFPNFFIKSIVALLCGGIIGWERERRGKPAGLRTNMLICVGSTLYMLLAELIMSGSPNEAPDTRIAAQVVTGIGFIGAGTIIQSRGTIQGLTSAAVIWTVAAIGLCIGAGYPLIAIYFTLLVVFVVTVLARYEHKLLGKCHFVTASLKFREDGGKVWAELSDILREYDVTTSDFEIRREKHTIVLDLRYCDKHAAHNRFLFDLWKASGVEEVKTERGNPFLPK
jgi:putative Mg2+ transporter-C (MgtC) family protein